MVLVKILKFSYLILTLKIMLNIFFTLQLKSKVAEEPKMILVTYYNATISMRFWKKAKVYAVRICEDTGQNKLKR